MPLNTCLEISVVDACALCVLALPQLQDLPGGRESGLVTGCCRDPTSAWTVAFEDSLTVLQPHIYIQKVGHDSE